MLITDKRDSEIVSRAAQYLREQNTTSRCLHFRLLDQEKQIIRAKNAIHTLITQHITAENPEIYFCEDGEIFILAPILILKEVRELTDALATLLDVTLREGMMAIYELSGEDGERKLTALLQGKYAQRKIQEEMLKKQTKQEHALKRLHQILNTPLPGDVTTQIQQRRASRKETTIMIVEDDEFSLHLVQRVLAKEAQLVPVSKPENVINSYAMNAPDILFLDINLPDVSGHQLLTKILSIDPQAYIIMLSGNADRENVIHAMKNGAKGFVGKPFTREKLIQYIHRCPTLKG